MVSRALDFLRVISLSLVVTELLLRREVIEFNLIPPPQINVLAVSEWEHKTYIDRETKFCFKMICLKMQNKTQQKLPIQIEVNENKLQEQEKIINFTK